MNEKQLIKQIKDDIVKNIKTHFNFEITPEKIQSIISEELKDRTAESSIEVRGLWDSWSLWQKLVWFWKIEMNFGKKEQQKYLDSFDGVDFTLPKKYWMEKLPKTVIIAEVRFMPVRPLEYIKVVVK